MLTFTFGLAIGVLVGWVAHGFRVKQRRRRAQVGFVQALQEAERRAPEVPAMVHLYLYRMGVGLEDALLSRETRRALNGEVRA